MNYILKPSQIDKIMKPFWDKSFDGAKIREINLSGEMWSGIVKVDDELGLTLLVGRPVGREDMMWYSNGHYFSRKWDLFGISPQEFNKSLSRYVKDNYGLDVTDII